MVQPLIEKKPFDTYFFKNLLESLSYSASGILSIDGTPKGVYDLLATEILSRYEWFECIEKAPDQRGVPFDYFCLRDRVPYIITFRNPINQIHEPSEVLKGRITRLVRCIEGLQAMLIQVSLKKQYYRIFHTKYLEPKSKSFLNEWRQECSISAVTWITGRMKETSQKLANRSPGNPVC